MGKKPQLYGCGVCVLYFEAARKHPELGMPDLLKKDAAIDEEGPCQSCWEPGCERGGRRGNNLRLL
jgi:hypothetical protein